MSVSLRTSTPLPSAEAKDKLIEPFITACRFCLWKREKMVHFGQRADVITKINACLSTSVSETDELPKYICCECFYKLNMLYEFQKMCGRSDYILKSYILKASGRTTTSSSQVAERKEASCSENIQPFKQHHNQEAPIAKEKSSLAVKAEEQAETSSSCGIEIFPSISEGSEMLSPGQQVAESKIQCNGASEQQVYIEHCGSEETEGHGHPEEVVKTEEQKNILIYGIPSNSRDAETSLSREQVTETKFEAYVTSERQVDAETSLSREQVTETKFEAYVTSEQQVDVENCVCNEIQDGSRCGNPNCLNDLGEIFVGERYSEGVDLPGPQLSIESVYTMAGENKENVFHLQPGQLSDAIHENLDFTGSSKRFDVRGTPLKGDKPNSVGRTGRKSRVSKGCCGEEKMEEKFSGPAPCSSGEVNCIDDQKVPLVAKTRSSESSSPAENSTGQRSEIGASNAVLAGCSYDIQDSEKKVKSECESSPHNYYSKDKENSDLQQDCLNSITSEVKQDDTKWKNYLSEKEMLIWKEWLELHGQTPTQNSKLFQCNICQKTVKNAYSLRRHMLVHTGLKPYKCPYCVKSFAFSFGFTVHIRTHTGERPYKCDECNREFTDKPSLKIHMRRHTGFTPHKCNICHKQFYTKNSLISHEKIHFEIYAFSCCECSKDFKRFYSLNLHMRIHTGIRPFTCPECDCRFIKSAHLKQHLRIHTGYKPFKCSQCSKSFSQYCNYRRHIQRHLKGIKVENNVVRL